MMSSEAYPEEAGRLEPWEAAARAILARSRDELFTHDWLIKTMNVYHYKNGRNYTEVEEARRIYMQQVDKLKGYLLAEHKMALRNVWGHGYEVVPVQEQTEWAMDAARRKLRKAIGQAQIRVKFTNLRLLNAEKRQQNADAQARLAFFKRSVDVLKL